MVKHCANPDCRHLEKNDRPAEYQTDVEVCADCGAALVDGPPPGAETRFDEAGHSGQIEPYRGRLVTVSICRNPGDLQAAEALLAAAGIRCLAAGEGAAGMFGGALTTRVQVPEELVPQARELLAAEGLAVGADGPAYEEARERIAEATEEERRRRGMPPLVYLLVLLGGVAYATTDIPLPWIVTAVLVLSAIAWVVRSRG